MNLGIVFVKRKTLELSSFRKVNFLIKYFSDLGFDTEDKTPFLISKEDIEILISRCNQVLSNHLLAPKLLPIVDEFSFESNPYNDSYFKEIGNVKEYLLKVLLLEFNNLDSNENIYLEIRDQL